MQHEKFCSILVPGESSDQIRIRKIGFFRLPPDPDRTSTKVFPRTKISETKLHRFGKKISIYDKVIKCFFLKKWANSGLFCFIIVLFTHNSNIKWKSVDVVPGIRIRSRRMECADGSTVLWRLSDQLFNEQSNCPFLVPNEHWESSKIKWEQISIFDLLLWNLIAWFKSRL